MSEERRKVLVDEENLRQVLQALNGPSHYIRELQVTRGSLFANPIDALVEEFNAAMEALNGSAPKTE